MKLLVTEPVGLTVSTMDGRGYINVAEPIVDFRVELMDNN